MEIWFLLFVSLCLCISLHSLLSLFNNKKLPPSPPTIPFLGNLLWLWKSSKNFSNLEPILRDLRARYGPIVTLHLGSRPSIFITTNEVAHRTLVQNGTTFASRPQALETSKIVFSNHRTISSLAYGPTWRLLRQHIMSIFHPSRLKKYSSGRQWALNVLKKSLLAELDSNKAILLVDHIQHAMFGLAAFLCFGEKLEEKAIRDVEMVQRSILVNFIRFNVLNFMPRLGKILFRNLWKELLELRKNQEKVLVPLIRARREKISKKIDEREDFVDAYIDGLFDQQVPQENNGRRNLLEDEIVSMCSEFLTVGTDTSITTLQWVMANLVKHEDIQETLAREINLVVTKGEEIKEEDLEKMPYLKAIVLETLRRHPPGHFIIPRAVIEETIFDGYHIPKDAILNYAVADMGRNPDVWEDPMEFKPERFFSDDGREVKFDLKGIKEIKMMPFGAGRRVCPSISMALLHLQYFVATMIRDFKWTAEDGNVDFSEKQEFTIVMKNPLRAHISSRID